MAMTLARSSACEKFIEFQRDDNTIDDVKQDIVCFVPNFSGHSRCVPAAKHDIVQHNMVMLTMLDCACLAKTPGDAHPYASQAQFEKAATEWFVDFRVVSFPLPRRVVV